MSESEVWKPIAGFEGSYECSTFGRVRSLPRLTKQNKWLPGGVLRPAPVKRGQAKIVYLRVDLAGRKVSVHTVILETFVGKRPPGYHCCHGDGDTLNNRLSNLRWGTAQDNVDDREAHGRTARGERNGVAKINAATAIAIRQAIGRPSAVAKSFGVSEGCVRSILGGRSWAHAK